MGFKKFYNTWQETAQHKSEEQLFFEVVSVHVPSVNSFIAWLALNKHIKPYVKYTNRKPLPVFDLPENQKILYIVKKVPKIKELAQEFSFKFKPPEYLND